MADESGTEQAVSTRKDHRFLVQLLLEIEQRFDVNDIQLEGVHIWPLVRLQFGRSFKETDAIPDAGLPGVPESSLTTEEKAPLPRNKAERTRLVKAHAAHSLEEPEKSALRFESDLKQVSQLDRPTFAVLTKIEKYYLSRPDGFYAPILDPVSEDLEGFGQVQRIALEPLPIKCANEPLRLDLAAFVATTELPELVVPRETDDALAEIESYAQEQWQDYPLVRKRIYSRFRRLRHRRAFFHAVFSELRPEFLVTSSFTGWLHAVWAAKDLGIPVIDVQHGGQGPIHYPTTHFGKLPPHGYHFLPDVLWLWGDQNTGFASKWLPGAANRHFPVVGGHRGVARWNRNRIDGTLNELDSEFIAKHEAKTNALITLSYALNPLMPVEMMNAVRETPDIHWLIRLHPIHRSSAARDQIVSMLREMGCSNFSIDEPTDVQLQTALFVSQVHFTPFSTSVREALAFGVPSAITHPAGELLFREEIASGALAYTPSTSDVVRFAEHSIGASGRSDSGQNNHVEVRDAAIENVIAAAKDIARKATPLSSETPVASNENPEKSGWFRNVSKRWSV